MKKQVMRSGRINIIPRSVEGRKLIIILCVLMCCPLIYAGNMKVDFMQRDKQLHAGGSFLLCGSGMLAAKNDVVRYAVVPARVLGLGYLKERTDERYNKLDIYADLTGIGSAMIFDIIVRKLILKL